MPISNPTSVPGCMLWLDAADPSTLFQDFAGTLPCNNNTPVSLWRDKSTRNNHFSNVGTVASKPLLSTIGMQNNLSAVCFDNTFTEYLTGNVTNFRFLTGGATIFSVCQPLSAAGQEVDSASHWCFGNIGGTAGGGFAASRGIFFGTSTTTGLTNESVTIAHESSTATSGRLGASTYARYRNTSEILTLTVSNTGTVLYQNSRIVPLNLNSGINTLTNSSPSAAGVTTSDNIVLNGGRSSGRITPGTQNNWQEFIIYDRVLSQSERIDVEDYIKTKWNLSDPIYNAYAFQNGLWSSPSTWLNNTKPTTASDVWATGRTVSVDENVTVQSLRTTLNGGNFAVSVPVTITLLGAGIVTGTEHCVISYLGGTDVVTVIGRITGSTTTANKVGIYNAETGIIRCISPGGVRAGTFAGAHGATPGDTGSLFITGPCYGSDSIATAYGVYINYIGYVNIVGDIFAGTQSPGFTFNGAIDLACTIRVTGNIFASSGANGLQDIGASKTDAADIRLCSSFRAGINGHQAIDLPKFLLLPKPYASYTKQLSAVNSPIVQYSAVDDYSIYLHPEAKDTALGVRYGAFTLSGIPFQLEGTMGVPDRTAVSYNTPVGNTLGVGIISVKSLQSAWEAPQNSLKVKNTIGQRANAAAQIKEFGDLLSKLSV